MLLPIAKGRLGNDSFLAIATLFSTESAVRRPMGMKKAFRPLPVRLKARGP